VFLDEDKAEVFNNIFKDIKFLDDAKEVDGEGSEMEDGKK